jgi:2-amino-4-hydroxy-6-hydroxymethyldihydropteridine diphosphokinase
MSTERDDGAGQWLYLGLGANLGDRAASLWTAIERLGRVLGEVRVSPCYETAPVGFEDQPDFLNLVLVGRTGLEPRAALRLALGIERALGRQRGDGPRFGPRTIDIDLLLYGARRFNEPDLQLPHPRLIDRAFVLGPLRDLEPALILPHSPSASVTVADLWSALPAAERAGVRRTVALSAPGS